MTHLDDLLACDDENIKISKQALFDIEPTSLEAIESCANTLELMVRKFGETSKYDEHHDVIEGWAKQHGVKGNKALYYLRDAHLIGSTDANDPTTQAKINLQKATAILARMHIALRLGRDFLFGITDMLSLRITPALGYMRVQSESFGQLKLLVDHPELGEEWFSSADDAKGKQFHNNWHSRIVSAIRDLDLHSEYSSSTNFAHHTRASGTAYGILLGGKKDKAKGEIKLIYQETDDYRLLYFWFGVYLKFHRKALQHISSLFPELTDDDINKIGVHDFAAKESIIWNKVIEVHKSMHQTGLTKVLGGTI
jgi:hypothetical protein